MLKHKIYKKMVLAALVLAFLLPITAVGQVFAGTICGKDTASTKAVNTTIDLGCNQQVANPILDLLFGIIRFLSAGVGIVVIVSIVIAGIQFTTARNNPQNVEAAINRIRTSLLALLIFIFAYAILNYLIPGGIFI